MSLYEVRECGRLRHESPSFMVTKNGYQIGGEIDSAGAGDATYPSVAAAWEAIASVATSGEMREALAYDDEKAAAQEQGS